MPNCRGATSPRRCNIKPTASDSNLKFRQSVLAWRLWCDGVFACVCLLSRCVGVCCGCTSFFRVPLPVAVCASGCNGVFACMCVGVCRGCTSFVSFVWVLRSVCVRVCWGVRCAVGAIRWQDTQWTPSALTRALLNTISGPSLYDVHCSGESKGGPTAGGVLVRPTASGTNQIAHQATQAVSERRCISVPRTSSTRCAK